MKIIGIDGPLSRNAAERYLLALLQEENPTITDLSKIKSLSIGEAQVDIEKEIQYIRVNGRASLLQEVHDAKDPFLSKPISIGYNTDTGIGIRISSDYKGFALEIREPGIIEAPELTIANDLIYFRRQASLAINNNEFPAVLSHYRAYLAAAISLIDCFLHRYLFHIRAAISESNRFSNIAMLGSNAPIQERIEAWFTTFCPHKIKEYRTTKYWSKFIELKYARNKIIHPSTPLVAYKYKEIVRFLNYATDGIGGFLAYFRVCANQSPNIGFISSICHLSDLRVVHK